MEVFPVTRPVSMKYYKEFVHKKQIRTPFEGGSVQTRPKYTKHKKKWTIGYRHLNDSEIQSLKSFFINNTGKKFLWEDPFGTLHTVGFLGDSLGEITIRGRRNGENIWDTGKIGIEERT